MTYIHIYDARGRAYRNVTSVPDFVNNTDKITGKWIHIKHNKLGESLRARGGRGRSTMDRVRRERVEHL